MKKLVALTALAFSLSAQAGEYQSSLLVQTGVMNESDLVIRNVSDLGKNKTCLAFYIQTSGTSPTIRCYEASQGFGAQLTQGGHLKLDNLVIRRFEDLKNKVTCMVAYVSTPGTSPAVDCYGYQQGFKGEIVEAGHLREGDLDVRRVLDSAHNKTCLLTYVDTKGTSPTVTCYDSTAESKGGLYQSGELKEGDLVVRKIVDTASRKACLVSYVSTSGTSSNVFCYDD